MIAIKTSGNDEAVARRQNTTTGSHLKLGALCFLIKKFQPFIISQDINGGGFNIRFIYFLALLAIHECTSVKALEGHDLSIALDSHCSLSTGD